MDNKSDIISNVGLSQVTKSKKIEGLEDIDNNMNW